MKTLFAALLFLLAAPAFAQHSVTLTWTKSPDSTTQNPGTVNVYRANAACPASGIGSLTYTNIATGQAPGGSYSDTSVSAGNSYCYYVTAVIGGAESAPSNTFSGVLKPAAPSLTGVVN